MGAREVTREVAWPESNHAAPPVGPRRAEQIVREIEDTLHVELESSREAPSLDLATAVPGVPEPPD